MYQKKPNTINGVIIRLDVAMKSCQLKGRTISSLMLLSCSAVTPNAISCSLSVEVVSLREVSSRRLVARYFTVKSSSVTRTRSTSPTLICRATSDSCKSGLLNTRPWLKPPIVNITITKTDAIIWMRQRAQKFFILLLLNALMWFKHTVLAYPYR